MPRRPEGLPEGRMLWRDRIVSRMSEEQERRGWSDAGLAKRISEHYPMSAATVWKLKHASPARGVSIDEAVAIAAALEYESLDAFFEVTVETGWIVLQLMGLVREYRAAEARMPGQELGQTLNRCGTAIEGRSLDGVDTHTLLDLLDQLTQRVTEYGTSAATGTEASLAQIEQFRAALRSANSEGNGS